MGAFEDPWRDLLTAEEQAVSPAKPVPLPDFMRQPNTSQPRRFPPEQPHSHNPASTGIQNPVGNTPTNASFKRSRPNEGGATMQLEDDDAPRSDSDFPVDEDDEDEVDASFLSYQQQYGDDLAGVSRAGDTVAGSMMALSMPMTGPLPPASTHTSSRININLPPPRPGAALTAMTDTPQTSASSSSRTSSSAAREPSKFSMNLPPPKYS